jgi:histidinol phosphatase-like enzyme
MHRNRPLRPLEGTETPTRGLFVDRWGTLLDCKMGRGGQAVCLEPDSGPWSFVPRTVDALFRAQQAGWHVYLIGNESGVAHGRVDCEHWLDLERDLLAKLGAQGVRVVRNYACLDHPLGRGPRKRPSVFLLPDTGTFYHALQMDGIVLEQSWVVGDSTVELAAGERAGMRTAGVRTGLSLGDRELAVDPTLVADDLADFIGTLLGSRVGAR